MSKKKKRKKSQSKKKINRQVKKESKLLTFEEQNVSEENNIKKLEIKNENQQEIGKNKKESKLLNFEEQEELEKKTEELEEKKPKKESKLLNFEEQNQPEKNIVKEKFKIEDNSKKKHKYLKHPKEKKVKEKTKKSRKIICLILATIAISTIAIVAIGYTEKYIFCVKKDLNIEVGSKTEIDARDFLKDYNAEGEIKILTDTSAIDFNKISEYDIELEYNNKKYYSKLHLIDTTPPEVKFKNVNAYIDYILNAEDFIESKNDVTQMTVEIENPPEINEFKEYNITIIVRDEGGNETRGEVILNTSWIKSEFVLELGNILTHEDLLANPEGDRDVLPQSELDRINASPVGEYEIKTVNQGVEFTTKIIIQDTQPPNLVLTDVTIYNDQETIAKEAFIKEVSDPSEYTTELKTEIPLKQVGTYDIEIEAKDIYGNATTQVAKLNIVKDTTGPIFSGLTAMSVSKNSNVDWNKGVSANDAKDGKCEFTVDTSGCNLSVAGSYTVTYTTKDKSGNTTKKTRNVTVNPDAQDVYAKADAWLANSGRDALSIKNYVSQHIKYSSSTNRSEIWGAWMGFTQLRGDCYVHAAALNMMLQRAGYSCRIVAATNYGHYWNLVNIGGTWRHLDATYKGLGLMNDEERKATLKNGMDWNRDAYPKAE